MAHRMTAIPTIHIAAATTATTASMVNVFLFPSLAGASIPILWTRLGDLRRGLIWFIAPILPHFLSIDQLFRPTNQFDLETVAVCNTNAQYPETQQIERHPPQHPTHWLGTPLRHPQLE